MNKQKTKFKQTEIGMIPENWEVKELNELCTLITDGKHGDCKNEIYSDYYFLSCKDVNGGILHYSKARQITKQDFLETDKRTNLQIGNILLTNSGTIGRLAIAKDPEKTRRTTFQKSVAIVKNKQELIRSEFLYYYFMSKEREIKELSGGTTQKNLLLKDLRSFKVAVPNKVIQTSIAKILSDLDSKIELLQKQNKTLEAIGQAIFKHWFVDFEFPNEEGKPYKSSGGEMVFNEELQREIPKGWEALKYSEIVNYTFGFPFNSKFFNEKDGFPIIRIRDLPNNDTAFFTMENYDAKYIVDAGNLVVGMDGEFRAYIWKGLEVLLNQRIVKILSKYEYVPRSYLYYVLFEPLRFIENSKVGTTVIHLNKQDLDSITVLLPDEKTLILFGEIVDKLLDKQVENHLQSIKLSLIRDGLLPKLMSGEIRVNNLEAGTE